MTVTGAILEARARNYRDRDDAPELVWSDPIDRTATVLRAFTYQTPEAAFGMATSPVGRDELGKTWLALDATERQLWRRRAALALEIGDRGLEG